MFLFKYMDFVTQYLLSFVVQQQATVDGKENNNIKKMFLLVYD